jgi:hypothetical protein
MPDGSPPEYRLAGYWIAADHPILEDHSVSQIRARGHPALFEPPQIHGGGFDLLYQFAHGQFSQCVASKQPASCAGSDSVAVLWGRRCA